MLPALLAMLSGCTPGEAAPETGVPYGFWGLNGLVSPAGLQQARADLNLTVFHTATLSPEHAVGTLLPMVREAGLQVTLRLTGDHHHYTTAAGDFSLDAWKGMLSRWAGAGLQPFVDDGTLLGHMLLDDIDTFARQDPTAAELDEMARYSKAILPGLMTFVRQQATDMPLPEGGTYRHVDAVVNQYKAAEGRVQDYAQQQVSRSAALDVGVIMGMNIADGGDGSSGQPGWRADKFAMSAEEIRTYGLALAAHPECGMFLNWEYDAQEQWSDGSIGADYFRQPAHQAALALLGQQLTQHRRVPLLKDER